MCAIHVIGVIYQQAYAYSYSAVNVQCTIQQGKKVNRLGEVNKRFASNEKWTKSALLSKGDLSYQSYDPSRCGGGSSDESPTDTENDTDAEHKEWR